VKLLAPLVLAGLAVGLLMAASAGVDGSHPWRDPQGRFMLWRDLEVGGDQHITYAACASYVPSYWIVGVEDKWDAVLPAWSFDPIANCNGAQTVLKWEDDVDSCAAVACIKILTADTVAHADHLDVQRAKIVFNFVKYEALSVEWRIENSAHEWGHIMGLWDHPGGQCAEGTLMGQIDTVLPCYQGPTPGDLSSVLCVYNRVCHTPGVWRAAEWHLRYSNSAGAGDVSFAYGNPTDVPLVGDWNGDGIDTPGVWRGGSWFLSNTFGGPATIAFQYGDPWHRPFVGDWNGDGIDTPGVWQNGWWYLTNTFGGPATIAFQYGDPWHRPFVGDWNGDRIDTPGVWQNAWWYLRNCFCGGVADITFQYGDPTHTPLVGDWR
jgi:hypothetical protein